MSDARVLLDAEFDPRVKSYWTWKPVLGLTLGIVTIPIAILYAVVAGFFDENWQVAERLIWRRGKDAPDPRLPAASGGATKPGHAADAGTPSSSNSP